MANVMEYEIRIQTLTSTLLTARAESFCVRVFCLATLDAMKTHFIAHVAGIQARVSPPRGIRFHLGWLIHTQIFPAIAAVKFGL